MKIYIFAGLGGYSVGAWITCAYLCRAIACGSLGSFGSLADSAFGRHDSFDVGDGWDVGEAVGE